MKLTRVIGLFFIWSFAATSAAVEEIPLSGIHIERLGVRFAAPVEVEEVEVLSAPARLVVPAMNEFIVSSLQAGLVVRLFAALGDEVKAGDPLAEVRSSAFLALQRDYLDALGAHEIARMALERQQQLVKEGIGAQRQLQEADNRARETAAALQQHGHMLGFSGLEDVDINKLRDSRALQQSLVVRAPMDGVVLERNVSTGEQVEEMAALFRIADLATLWLELRLAPRQLEKLHLDMAVCVDDCAVSKGRIVGIGQQLDLTTQTVRVRATIDNPDKKLLPGQMVRARVMGNDHGVRAWSLPGASIARSGGEVVIFVRNDNGVEVRNIVILGGTQERYYVSGNLDTWDSVAYEGIAALKSIWQGLEAE
jgi:cobalt-zinc-cadmium efflux system membrane fusion protein